MSCSLPTSNHPDLCVNLHAPVQQLSHAEIDREYAVYALQEQSKELEFQSEIDWAEAQRVLSEAQQEYMSERSAEEAAFDEACSDRSFTDYVRHRLPELNVQVSTT